MQNQQERPWTQKVRKALLGGVCAGAILPFLSMNILRRDLDEIKLSSERLQLDRWTDTVESCLKIR